MKKLGSVAEFGLVVAFGVTLTLRATGAPATAEAPMPSIEQIEAAVAQADAQADAVNGR